MSLHFLALGRAFGVLLLLTASCAGWGRMVWPSLRFPGSSRTTLAHIWVGWGVTLVILQTLHLVLPLTAAVTIPVFGVGILLLLQSGVQWDKVRHEMTPYVSGLTAVASAAVCWVLSRAMVRPVNFDSGLYHFNAIRWIEYAPIVPGLGNLHGRLAFNQAFFVYAAALDLHPFYGQGRGLANTFLLILLAATAFERAHAGFISPFRESGCATGAAVLVLPLIAYLALASNGLASPSPDLTSTILQIAMFLELAKLCSATELDERISLSALIAGMAVTAGTIKLSNGGFSAAMIVIAITSLWSARPSWKALASYIVMPAVVIVGVWVIRGVVLSGAPFYPSTFGWLPVDWAVPRSKIVDEANWIYSWARQPGSDWRVVLGRWDWVRGWMETMRGAKVEVVYPVGMALVFLTVSICIPGSWRRDARTAILLVPPVASLVFWLVTAPDLRFAHASILLLVVAGGLLLMTRLSRILAKKNAIAAAFFVVAAANVHIGYYIVRHRDEILKISRNGWEPVPQARFMERTTSSGLRIFIPQAGGCWDSPLPCTPNLDSQLTLRRPGDLRGGFCLRSGTVNSGSKHD